ncbi:MAG: nucleotidyltransferase family protein [Clostridia bacterium]|nr:nucleotidyltransferase family protein [Clostridia bacterium]
MMNTYELLTDALRCAMHGERVQWDSIEGEELSSLIELSREHRVLPMLAEAAYCCAAVKTHPRLYEQLISEARSQTVAQAQRTADFLLFYSFLNEKGLRPVITKGVMCRRLYPYPDQRTSVDEDLLIDPGQFRAYHGALIEFGMDLVDPESVSDFETSYVDRVKNLYIEVHKSLFDEDSKAYGDCNAPFAGALERSIETEYEGVKLRTLSHTDHMLYLLLHSYKHLLHGGFGIRQAADICMFGSRSGKEIDWKLIRTECEKLRIERFAAAIFTIGAEQLAIDKPKAFADIAIGTEHLLLDMLSGGLYGVEDINRAHSSTLTIEAVAADRTGRRRKGAIASLFPPRRALEGRFGYLKKHPWLLPAAWAQRTWSYLTKREHGPVSPSESLKIGRERIELLREYGIIE